MDIQSHQRLTECFADHFQSGQTFQNIVEARKFAATVLQTPVEPATELAKEVDEAIEGGLVQVARVIVAQANGDQLTAFDDLRDLYDRQPNLLVKTSDSIRRQAYSTPLPIAHLAGVLAQVHPSQTTYEPTAGNGSLLLLADPSNAIVNEIYEPRAAELRSQGFSVTEQDATKYSPSRPYDVLIANPPFGIVQVDGAGPAHRWQHGPLNTNQVDHAIALKALENLQPGGRAVLILGGKLGDEAARRQSYRSQTSRGFFKYLYQDSGWKVEDHFSIQGSLYRRQGAGFPIDLVVINGRGKTDLALPGVTPPRLYKTYDQLRDEVLKDAITSYDQRFMGDRETHRVRPPASRSPTSGLDASALAEDESGGSRNLVDHGAGTRGADASHSGGVSSPASVATRNEATAVHPGLAVGGGFGEPSDRSVDRRAQRGDATRLAGGDRAEYRDPDQFPLQPSAQGDVSRGAELLPRQAGDNRERDDGGDRGLLELQQLAETVSGRSRDLGPEVAIVSQVVSEPEEPTQEAVTLPYTPRSQGPRLGVLAPASAIAAYETKFDQIEAQVGSSVDEYVRDRLSEDSLESLYAHYAAEQIDTLALAIHNHEYKGQATVIGHDTGIGKTRVVAGLCRYANQQGLIPTVVTDSTALYKDLLYRDGPDTGNHFNAFITDNGLRIPVEDKQGNRVAQIKTPNDNHKQVKQFTQAGDIGEHDLMLTTYDQLKGPNSKKRRELLDTLAPQLFLIADEAHNAGGPAGSFELSEFELRQREIKIAAGTFVAPVTEYFQDLTQKTAGFVASSATAIKEPVVAARLYYHTTDFKDAAQDQATFAEHLQVGGAAMQQSAFDLWSEAGGCIRFQKDYSGIDFEAQEVTVNLDRAEENARLIQLINQFDQAREARMPEMDDALSESGEKLFVHDNHVGYAGIDSAVFSSVAHNLHAVCALGLKAEATATLANQEIEAGKKPVIMLTQTAESVLQDYIRETNESVDLHNALHPDPPDQMPRLEPGQPINITAGEFFQRYLEKARTIRIIGAYADESGKKKILPHYLTDDELGPMATALYEKAKTEIEQSDWSQQPADPISLMEYRIKEAGHNVEEMTGRKQKCVYQPGDDGQLFATLASRQSGAAQKVAAIARFQSGETDALITNLTTGYSIHADRRAADQRQRVMLMLQPHADVNRCEQSIGRTHRSGQLNPSDHEPDTHDQAGNPQWGQVAGAYGLPQFKLMYGKGLATEQRPLAVLMKKMRHLKSNTVGSGQSQFSGADVPDFMNQYGDQAAANVLSAWPEVNAAMDYPAGKPDENGEIKTASVRRVTGRAILLADQSPPTPENPHPSLKLQEQLYAALTEEYQGIKAQKEAIGEWDLDAQKLDLDAIPVRRKLLHDGDGSNPFRQPAYALEVDAKTGGKPLPTLQVVQEVHKSLNLEPPTTPEALDFSPTSSFRQVGQQRATAQIQQLEGDYDAYREAKLTELGTSVQKFEQRLADLQHKQDALSKQKARLTERAEQIVPEYDAEKQRLQDTESLNPDSEEALTQKYERERKKVDRELSKTEKALEEGKGRIASQKNRLDDANHRVSGTDKVLQYQRQGVETRLTEFPVGQPVLLASVQTGESVPGVVVNAQRAKNASNPVNPNSWRLRVQVANEAREISVKFSDIGRNVALKPQEDACLSQRQENGLYQAVTLPTYEAFDLKQEATRETRYMVVGQVLATDLIGKFAQMQDHEGHYHPAYLLPRGFNDTTIDERPVGLDRPEQVQAFLAKTARTAKLTDRNDRAEIEFDVRRCMTVTVPAGKEGKSLSQDSTILDAAGGAQFVNAKVASSSGSRSIMRLSVKGEDTQDAVLAAIQRKHGLKALTRLEDAQSVIGATKSEWETAITWLPEADQGQASQSQRAIHPLLKAEIARNPDFIPSEQPEIFQSVSDQLYEGRSMAEVAEEMGLTILEIEATPDSAPEPDSDVNSPLSPEVQRRRSEARAHLDETFSADMPAILPPSQQGDKIAGHVAKLLRRAGLEQAILTGDPERDGDFHLRVPNEPYMDLVIEAHDVTLSPPQREMTLTHYVEVGGDLCIDTDMRLSMSAEGKLSFVEVGVNNSLTGGTTYAPDASFGQLFARNLIDQGFDWASHDAYLDQVAQGLEATAALESPEPLPDESLPEGTGPYHPSLQRHAEAKAAYPDAVAFIRTSSGYETFGPDAEVYASATGMPLETAQFGLDPDTPTVAQSSEKLNQGIALLNREGRDVAIAEIDVANQTAEHNGEIEVFSGADVEVVTDELVQPNHPFLQQQAQLKQQYPDAIALVRTPIRYEAYGQDAQVVARVTQNSLVTATWPLDEACERASVLKSEPEFGQAIASLNAAGLNVAVGGGNRAVQLYESAPDLEPIESPSEPEPIGRASAVEPIEPPSESKPVNREQLVDDLRSWYREALLNGRSADHLARIKEVGLAVVAGNSDEFGPRDQAMREEDRTIAMSHAENVRDASKYLIETLGQPEAGALAFRGKTYSIVQQGKEMAVTANPTPQSPERLLLHVSEGSVDHAMVSHFDASMFRKQVDRVAAYLQPHAAPSAKVAPTKQMTR
ncbi:MAG: DEAD/DEAH box helicase family protein [Leptolyngbya sp. SIOISBB]|nr:DEAD/DEAH box helicase family protein [Leptolyngbya sp. SIOISBB]